MAISLKVNGKPRTVDAAPGTPLLWVLRDHLGLTGTKFGCGAAQCGACTVHVNGEPTRACVTPHDSLADAEIVTIEGVSGAAAEAIRNAWIAKDVPQCGYCQAGQIMSATALLKSNPAPDDAAIDEAMSGNLCRCATYMSIRRAIKEAAATL
ncbi:MAG: (2Fe-2S)-binding protein [Blastomonas sp.]|jgi:isoquinoline 1-oxidoreductase alpha subunit|uniref:(2Fe-2S)-binding protein n=1 Tax=unclassified Blastomonas TaxID=2626550 RepID=UPI0008296FA0|nr:(2Fe-2S)-binding protein [Blastomonas sp.]MCH2236521.1 (2Fe-2S)-binding protein [Blastomonas sp.]OHD02622.1 MAG: isoquinoline 1-oxidoreductase [Sphingopyxis sp. RIFCSPHIGHO2_01_FULL_65_24]